MLFKRDFDISIAPRIPSHSVDDSTSISTPPIHWKALYKDEFLFGGVFNDSAKGNCLELLNHNYSVKIKSTGITESQSYTMNDLIKSYSSVLKSIKLIINSSSFNSNIN